MINSRLCFWAGFLFFASCASWDPMLVKTENGKNRYVKIEHPNCPDWRAKLDQIITSSSASMALAHKASLNCLKNGPDDSHKAVAKDLEASINQLKTLYEDPQFTQQKVGQCFGRPVNTLFSLTFNLTAQSAQTVVAMCSTEVQSLFESAKNPGDFQEKLDEFSKSFFTK